MGALDATLERIYQRLGWRTIPLYMVLGWSAVFSLALAGILIFARIEQLRVAETLGLLGSLLLIIAGGCVLSTIGTLRFARPLTAWLDGDRAASQAEEVTTIALQVPRVAIRWGVRLALVFSPVAVFVIAAFASSDFDDTVLIALMVLAAVALALFASTFMAQIVLRPLVLDVMSALARPPAPREWVSVRTRLLVFVPLILIAAATAGVVSALNVGDDFGGALGDMFFAVAVVLLFAVPVALLLAYSTLQPLDDLLKATERLKAGDFSTRVPELSADEHGVLARSFNEAMVGLAERQRLAGENEELLEEVRASRARIIAASDAERRRVERNIHDGAQQRLVALALQLRMLEEEAGGDPAKVRAMAGEASDGLKGALDELRELARGLHPSVLSTDGLRPALEQLANRAPVPVRVSAPDDRFPDAIESTAYFVASEALANVAKYSEASTAEVSVERRNGRLQVAISDDGKGGADPEAGSGLAGLADRVAALDGRLTVESPAGRGTKVTAELPLGANVGS